MGNVTKWSGSMLGTFDSIFDDFVNALENEEARVSIYPHTFPPMDVLVNKNSKDLLVRFAVAGFTEKELSLSVEGDHLILSAKKEDQKEECTFEYIQSWISKKDNIRKYIVPSSKYNLEEIKSFLENGILEVFIPAREKIKPKEILIKRN